MQLIPIEKMFSNRDSIRKAKEAFFNFKRQNTCTSWSQHSRRNILIILFRILGFLLLFSFYFTLSLLSFWVDPTHFLCYINILLIKHTNVNSTSLYLKKAGLASRNIVYLLKFHLRCIRLCFYIFVFIC